MILLFRRYPQIVLLLIRLRNKASTKIDEDVGTLKKIFRIFFRSPRSREVNRSSLSGFVLREPRVDSNYAPDFSYAIAESIARWSLHYDRYSYGVVLIGIRDR